MRRLLAVLLSFFLMAPTVQAQSTADEGGALTTVRTFIRANETANLDVLVSTFSEVATVFLPAGDAPYRLTGTSQIRAAFAAVFRGRTGIKEPLSFARRTFVLHREGDKWLIVHLHASNFQWNPPGA